MELAILRHGDAYSSEGGSDFERTLSPTGRRQVIQSAQAMRSFNGNVWRIIASPAHRTRESADLVCRVLSASLDTVHWEPAVYNASLATLIGILREYSTAQNNVLIIGHNPGVTLLSGHAAGLGMKQPSLSTGSLARLRIYGDLSRYGCGKLLELFEPTAPTPGRVP